MKTIYIPSDLRKEGFDRELEGYTNAVTLVLVKPDVPLSHVVDSLKTVIQDLELRQRLEKEN